MDGSRDRNRTGMEPTWLSLAAASKQELEVVTDMLTGVIRYVSLHPHLAWSPCPPENACSMASPLLILEESVHFLPEWGICLPKTVLGTMSSYPGVTAKAGASSPARGCAHLSRVPRNQGSLPAVILKTGCIGVHLFSW